MPAVEHGVVDGATSVQRLVAAVAPEECQGFDTPKKEVVLGDDSKHT